MKIEINLGKLLEFYDMCSENYDLSDGNGFRAFVLDFVCHGDKEEDWYRREEIGGYSEDVKIKSDILINFDDISTSIVYDTKEAAEYVLQKMKDILCERKIVKVADYVWLSNQKPEREMYYFGWANLNSTYIYSYGCEEDGNVVYAIHLPKALPIAHFEED